MTRRGRPDPARPTSSPLRWRAEIQVSVVVCCGDMLAGRPLYEAIVEQARHAGLAGATVVQGLAGLGHSAVVRKPGLLGRSGYEPVLIEIADAPGRVQAFLPELRKIAPEALVLLKSVQVADGARLLPRSAGIAAR